jgi:hypothetical protein
MDATARPYAARSNDDIHALVNPRKGGACSRRARHAACASSAAVGPSPTTRGSAPGSSTKRAS